MTDVTLTRDELVFAGQGGLVRQIDAECKRRQDQFKPPDAWKNHVLGAMGEAAFAKLRDHYWFPCYDAPSTIEADVGKRWQVRTHDRPAGELIVRARDRDDQAFVLVVAAIPVFRIVGWVWGHQAKRDEFAKPASDGRPPAWFVPQAQLRAL